MRQASVVFILAVSLVLVPQAAAAKQGLDLTGETLSGTTTVANVDCRAGAADYSFTYSASGTASGPYPGTFTESGRYERVDRGQGKFDETFEATFNIVSGPTVISGSKRGGFAQANLCFSIFAGVAIVGAKYEAMITSPNANGHDHGLTDAAADPSVFIETFDSKPNKP